ncbi:MAG TPA: hypothetical protein VFG51_01580 [Candidatus Saccharimonadia bacterium]|nr:hypothetical protein [Candidatus Saccharimonadia bacterium]
MESVRRAEREAYLNLTTGFWRIIEAGQPLSTGHAHMMTTQGKKVGAAQEIADHRTGGELVVAHADIPDFVETQTSSAADAAMQKAEHGRDYYARLHPDSHEPFLGADVVHWANGALIHKLDRNKTPDTEGVLARRLTNLKRHYGRQDGKENLDIYNGAMAMANTAKALAEAFIFVWSHAFDPQQVQHYIDHSLETGMYRKSNSRGALFEAVAKHSLIKKVAIIPSQYFDREGRNADVTRWQQDPSPLLLNAIAQSIDTTTPGVILGMRNPLRRPR